MSTMKTEVIVIRLTKKERALLDSIKNSTTTCRLDERISTF
ncbi:hypothetical protein ACNARU_00040 [Proteus sp. WDL240414]|uniref:Transposase n=1 Tax=Proteus genomosp. 6 TaxID=1311820 RepID=A0ABV1L4I2_9GAMM